MTRPAAWIRLTLVGAGLCLCAPATPAKGDDFEVRYDVRLCSSENAADVEIRVEQERDLLRELRFSLSGDGDRMRGVEGDGELRREDGALFWRIPGKGGVLRYVAEIDHLREPAEYDARCADRWALLRGTDLVPIVTATLLKRARARTQLRFRLPADWRVVTPFEPVEPRVFRVDQPGRDFDAPRGWILAGELEVLRAEIGPASVVLASPEGQDTRARGRLALLRWTLPVLNDILIEPLRRLLIVSADDPMWRGGLSGPHSFYLHADRPLIGADGTSPLLHELVHVAMGAESGENGDWIIEGLAELYSVELLRRSGTITEEEAAKTFASMREGAGDAESLRTHPADGDTTRRAVVTLRALDERIRSASDDRASLDDVLRRLAGGEGSKPVTSQRLQAEAEAVTGGSLEDFFAREVD